MTLNRSPNRKVRTAALVVLLSSWAERPRTLSGFDSLLAAQGVPEERKRALRRAWRAGGLVYFLADSGRYATRNASLPVERMENELSRAIAADRLWLRELGRKLVAREITPDEFLAQAGNAIEQAVWDGALVLFGPLLFGLPAILNIVMELIRQQKAYFERMMSSIFSGAMSLDGAFLRRLMMYAGGAWVSLWEAHRFLAIRDGKTEERNLLGIAEHCDGCLEETGKGWQPIGTLVPVGSRDCLSNCRCRLEYR